MPPMRTFFDKIFNLTVDFGKSFSSPLILFSTSFFVHFEAVVKRFFLSRQHYDDLAAPGIKSIQHFRFLGSLTALSPASPNLQIVQ